MISFLRHGIATASESAKRHRWFYEALFWAAIVLAALLFPSQHLLMIEISIIALFALSLDLLLGYAGVVSLGHAAFFGFGAYLAGLLALHGIVREPVLAMLLTGLISGLIGLAASTLVLRGSDLTKIMVTLGLALVFYEIANRLTWLTGGADGMTGIEIAPLLGLFEFDFFGHIGLAYCLVVLFLLFIVARCVVDSPFGWSIKAIRDNPTRASAIGVPTHRRLMAMFALSAAYAGIAGALLTQTTSFVSLSVLHFERSADVLLMLLLGGTGYLYGGLVGAVIFKLLHSWIASLTPEYWQFWIGAFLVAIVLLRRASIRSALASIGERFRPAGHAQGRAR